MYWPKWPISLRYVSRDIRRIDFPQVDGLSTDTPGLGRHRWVFWFIVILLGKALVVFCLAILNEVEIL